MRGEIKMGWLQNREIENEKEKLKKVLFGSKPITPKYTRAADIGIGGVKMFINDRDRQFFRDFATFADLFNRMFISADDDGFGGIGPWRLQELEDTELSWPGQDTPAYGCRYSVHYNQMSLGILQISADDLDYSTDNPLVNVDMDLEHIRMLPFSHVQTFLQRLVEFITPRPDYNYPPAREMINGALLALLWPYKPEYEDDADMSRSLEFGYNDSAINFIKHAERGK
jgi:hypothetical protein